MASDRHGVSVVIPTINRASLGECTEALKGQTRPPDELLVIRDPARRGPAWARNEGIRRAAGDLIAFTDDDCVPPLDWLERLVDAVDAFDAAGAGGSYDETDPLLQDIRRRRRYPDRLQIDPGGLVGQGGNVLYRRAWLERCAERYGHVFDESYRMGQDTELAWRLRRLGATLVFVPVNVRHLRRLTLTTYCRYEFGRGIAIAQLYRAHRTLGRGPTANKSLLWNESDAAHETSDALLYARWLAALSRKTFGPFDWASFASARNFWLYWVGKKFEGAGFLHEMARYRLASFQGEADDARALLK
jgi:glycosyltransferase involved in cell wall biosynthesis